MPVKLDLFPDLNLHIQKLMDKKNILIGDKEYTVELAVTLEEQKKGLQNRDFLAQDAGMLFVYDKPQKEEKFWMKDTNIALDQIGINGEGEVTKVYTAKPKDETLVPFEDIQFLLEVNANSGIKVGDQFDFDESEDPNKYVMKVIASDCSTQMNLQAGERIFSRVSTKQLIQWAKKAEANKDNQELFDRYCKRLGKRMFKEIKAQDTRKPEYVEK